MMTLTGESKTDYDSMTYVTGLSSRAKSYCSNTVISVLLVRGTCFSNIIKSYTFFAMQIYKQMSCYRTYPKMSQFLDDNLNGRGCPRMLQSL